MKLELTHPDPESPVDPRAEAMLPAVGGFPPSDRGLFLAGYGELCRVDLSRYEDESFDLVFGQAALHHLSHDLDGIAREARRVLKPGGRLVFIFEPMGHNLLVAAIRAARMARHELGDESNLYLSQFERMAGCFRSCEVQMFNLLGYPMKAVSDRWQPLAELVQRIDHRLMSWFPGLKRYAANCNLVLTK